MEEVLKKLEEIANVASYNNIVIEALRLSLKKEEQAYFIKNISQTIKRLEGEGRMNSKLIEDLSYSIKFK